jgi:L-asparaginase II
MIPAGLGATLAQAAARNPFRCAARRDAAGSLVPDAEQPMTKPPRDAAIPPASVLSAVTRSGEVESTHRGHVVVVRGGAIAHAFGDPHVQVYTRSAIKPLQALPLFDRGIVARLGLTDEELALVSASHQGAALHVDVVRGLLAKGGLAPDDLGCGPHAPFDRDAAQALVRAGEAPARIHNNCSGKHAGFLLLAQACGTPLRDYLHPDSTAQQLVRAAVADMTRTEANELYAGVDGCGAPTLRMPLSALAIGFWQLTNPQGLSASRRVACARMLAAITRAPLHLAGHGRLCTALIASAPGRVYPKNGAEGVYAVGVAGLDFAVAIKVEDGAERGYVPVVLDVLAKFGLWPAVPRELAEFARKEIRNTRKEVVGHIASVLPW